jgi:hypothetical protein
MEQAPKFQLLSADPRVQVLADAIMSGRTEFLTNMGYAYGSNPFARVITFRYEGIVITFRNHGSGKRLWTNRGGYFEVVICDDRGEGDFTVFYYIVYARK